MNRTPAQIAEAIIADDATCIYPDDSILALAESHRDLLAALELALPVLEDEYKVLEASFLPNPNPDESEEIEAARKAVFAGRAALARATGGAA